MAGGREGADLATEMSGELLRLADAGSAEAAALLAGILLEYFDESALPMAVTYAKASAEAGSPAGRRTYGYMLAEGVGVGVEKDGARAIELFRAAAEGGDAYGAFNLARRSDDHAESLRLLERAAGQGLHGTDRELRPVAFVPADDHRPCVRVRGARHVVGLLGRAVAVVLDLRQALAPRAVPARLRDLAADLVAPWYVKSVSTSIVSAVRL
jgi:hypothetical protein